MEEHENDKKKLKEKINDAKRNIEKELEDEKQKLLDDVAKKAKKKKKMMDDEVNSTYDSFFRKS